MTAKSIILGSYAYCMLQLSSGKKYAGKIAAYSLKGKRLRLELSSVAQEFELDQLGLETEWRSLRHLNGGPAKSFAFGKCKSIPRKSSAGKLFLRSSRNDMITLLTDGAEAAPVKALIG